MDVVIYFSDKFAHACSQKKKKWKQCNVLIHSGKQKGDDYKNSIIATII